MFKFNTADPDPVYCYNFCISSRNVINVNYVTHSFGSTGRSYVLTDQALYLEHSNGSNKSKLDFTGVVKLFNTQVPLTGGVVLIAYCVWLHHGNIVLIDQTSPENKSLNFHHQQRVIYERFYL